MQYYYADTSFWLALLSRRDAFHAAAVHWRKAVAKDPIITTHLVLWEVLNACSASPLKARAAGLFDRCLTDPQIEVIWPDMSLVRKGVDLFRSRLDKAWSFTDCVSFVIMQLHQIDNALTTDHHFEQAGFKTLLREE